MRPKHLKGKVALITGASKGIGRAIAHRYEYEGADLAFTYVSSTDKTHELELEMKVRGVKIRGFRSDASDFQDAQRVVDEVLEEYGRIDILVNNAGITQDNLLLRMSEENWDRVIDVNLKSCFNMVKACSRQI